MSLFFIDDVILGPSEGPAEARAEFMAGIKAAFIVSQMNRLGQVLCGGCGVTRDDLATAFIDLQLVHATAITGKVYGGGLEWGDDHPANLILICSTCATQVVLG